MSAYTICTWDQQILFADTLDEAKNTASEYLDKHMSLGDSLVWGSECGIGDLRFVVVQVHANGAPTQMMVTITNRVNPEDERGAKVVRWNRGSYIAITRGDKGR